MDAYRSYKDGLNQVLEKILFREKEVNYLIRLFGPPQSLSCQSVFIYGHSCSGKTYVVSELMQELKVPFAWINCHEVYSPCLLFSSLTEKLLQKHKSLYGAENISSCETLNDFVNFLKENLKDVKETTYLIFDDAVVLRDKEPGTLAALLRLQELTNVNICTVLISEIVWEKFRLDLGMCPPVLLHFNEYSKGELLEILCLDCPPDYSNDFYVAYINVIMNVFFVATRNLQELRHLALIHFPKYCEPVVSEKVSPTEVHKLWKNIEPVLREAVHTVYLREISGWNLLQNENRNVSKETGEKLSSESSTVTNYRMTTELPFYSKFLLLAAYLASYNPPRTDHRYFVKNQGKTRKKQKGKKNEVNIHLLGPKAFILDRMLAIFYSIVEDGVLPSALIFSQISSLVKLQLLVCITPDDQLSSPKYKCLAELDLIRSIGRTVNFDIMRYLNDFT